MAKSRSSESSRRERPVLTLLEGRSCPDCSDGTLERATYKENQAIVCDSCGVPRVQVW